MNGTLRTALAALPARQLYLVAAGSVAIAALLAWAVALRAPLAVYRQQQSALAALRTAAAGAPAAPTAAPIPTPTAAPTTVPMPRAVPVPPVAGPTPLALIAAIGASAAQAGVAVLSAAEGGSTSVAGLRQQIVQVTAAGSYAAIVAWLDDVERSQPAVAILQLELHPAAAGQQREARVQLAIYGGAATP